MNRNKILFYLILISLVSITFIPRVLDLDTFRAPDEKRWIANINGFTTKLATGRWQELMQQPHPGITTQWLGAPTNQYDDWTTKKLPLVIGQGLLVLAIGYIYARLWGIPAGLILTFLLASNPLLYAHTRIIAMDSLLALFLLLSLGLLFLWHNTKSTRYLLVAALTAAAAFLSKLPGIIIAPFSLAIIGWWQRKELVIGNWSLIIKSQLLWLILFVVGLLIILPSFAFAPIGTTNSILELFRSDDYQTLHQANTTYYLRTLTFFSTPTHLLLILALPLTWWLARNSSPPDKGGLGGSVAVNNHHIILLLLFATLFTLQMTLGLKKGDRYILPTFIALDAIAALTIAWLYKLSKSPPDKGGPGGSSLRRTVTLTTYYLLLTTVAWTATITWTLHPHTLAYVNPITRPFFNDHRHGWGEGLDLAAAYLNAKPNARNLKAASYYPNEFGHYFKGETVPAHQHDTPDVDYVILYRAMYDRGPEAWETDVLNHYQEKTPEKVITLSGVEMVLIHTASKTSK